MLKEVPAVARITTLRNHSHLFAINVIHDINTQHDGGVTTF